MANEELTPAFTAEELEQQAAVQEATRLVLASMAATDTKVAMMGMINGVVSILMAANPGMTSAEACGKMIDIIQRIHKAEVTGEVVRDDVSPDSGEPDSVPGNEPEA